MSGNRITDLFQTVMWYTTLTGIGLTIPWKTLLLSLLQSIICSIMMKKEQKEHANIWRKFDPWLQHGIVQKKDEHGTENLAKWLGKAESQLRSFVKTVGKNLRRWPCMDGPAFVQTSAKRTGDTNKGLMMKRVSVQSAEQNLYVTGMRIRSVAPVYVLRIVDLDSTRPVYNLEVEDAQRRLGIFPVVQDHSRGNNGALYTRARPLRVPA